MRERDTDDTTRTPLRTTRRTLMHGVGLGGLLGLTGTTVAAGPTADTENTVSPATDVRGDEISWYRTDGDGGRDRFHDLTSTDGGGVTTIGVTTSRGDGPEAWQHHWTPEGEQGWAERHGDAGADVAFAVARARAGCYVLCGRTRGGEGGTDRFYVVETGSRGGVNWTSRFRVGPGDGQGNDVVQTADGGYAVAGVSGHDGVLAKLGPEGTVRWTRTFSGGRSLEVVSLLEVDDGFVLGGTVADGDGRDFLLLGTDTDGRERWRQTYSAGEDDRLAQCIDAGDGYLLAGTTESARAFTTDALFVRTDRAGEVVWERTYGREGEEFTAAGVTAVDDGYVFVGTRSVDVIGPELWLGSIDETGERTERYAFGTERPETPVAVTVTDDGRIAVVGFRDPSDSEEGTDGFVAMFRPE